MLRLKRCGQNGRKFPSPVTWYFMRAIRSAFACLLLVASIGGTAHAGTRLKDIIDVEGVRENQLIGYGVVFGLKGSGDSLRNCAIPATSGLPAAGMMLRASLPLQLEEQLVSPLRERVGRRSCRNCRRI